MKNPESYDDNRKAVNMGQHSRSFFHTLAPYLSLNEDEKPEVKPPDNIIPAGSVPLAGAEPYEKKVKILSALSEKRDLEKVITEERPQGYMPSLPELGYVFADKGVNKVFVKMESKDTAKAYGHI